MILVLTTPSTDRFETVSVPAKDYAHLVSKVSLIYRRAGRPVTLGRLILALGAKKAEGHAVGFITVDSFKAKISYPGMPEFVAQTYEGRPNVNIIPRYVPDLPRSVSGFSIKD